MLIVVWPHWTDLLAAVFGIAAGLWAIRQGRLYKRRRRELGNAVYRLPVPAPGQPKTTILIEGEAPQTAYWEKVDLDREQP